MPAYKTLPGSPFLGWAKARLQSETEMSSDSWELNNDVLFPSVTWLMSPGKREATLLCTIPYTNMVGGRWKVWQHNQGYGAHDLFSKNPQSEASCLNCSFQAPQCTHYLFRGRLRSPSVNYSETHSRWQRAEVLATNLGSETGPLLSLC